MTYEEYILSKHNRYVYQGESKEELINALTNIFNYECLLISEDNRYTPIKPPVGTIFVGDDVNNGWISDKVAFYGWNIQFVKGFCSNEIKFK